MSDDLIEALRLQGWDEQADHIEQLERENQQLTNTLGFTNTAWDQALDQRNKAEAKLAKAVEIGNKMAASIKGNYYIPNVVAEWVTVLAELEGKE